MRTIGIVFIVIAVMFAGARAQERVAAETQEFNLEGTWEVFFERVSSVKAWYTSTFVIMIKYQDGYPLVAMTSKPMSFRLVADGGRVNVMGLNVPVELAWKNRDKLEGFSEFYVPNQGPEGLATGRSNQIHMVMKRQ